MKAAAREKLHDPVDRPPGAQTDVTARPPESLGGQGSPEHRPVAALPLDE